MFSIKNVLDYHLIFDFLLISAVLNNCSQAILVMISHELITVKLKKIAGINDSI